MYAFFTLIEWKLAFLQILHYILASTMCCTATREGNICHDSPLQTWFSSKLTVLLLSKYICEIVCVYYYRRLLFTHPDLTYSSQQTFPKTRSCSGTSTQLCSHHLQDLKPKIHSRDQTAFFPLNLEKAKEVPCHLQPSIRRNKTQLRSEFPLEAPIPLPWLWKHTAFPIRHSGW